MESRGSGLNRLNRDRKVLDTSPCLTIYIVLTTLRGTFKGSKKQGSVGSVLTHRRTRSSRSSLTTEQAGGQPMSRIVFKEGRKGRKKARGANTELGVCHVRSLG